MLHKELREVRELGFIAPPAELPPHLAGLPECLHKYGALFAAAHASTEAPREETAA